MEEVSVESLKNFDNNMIDGRSVSSKFTERAIVVARNNSKQLYITHPRNL